VVDGVERGNDEIQGWDIFNLQTGLLLKFQLPRNPLILKSMKNLKFALLALVAMPDGHAATTLTSNGSNPASQGWTLSTSGNAGQFSSANPKFNGGSSSVVAGNAWGL